ncbi:MAG TPA: MOSC domain-containing protein [Phycisphaerae bacterium]|nr:MOSC domain-containing protein [Phycisphaerae bacterium]
MRIISLNIGRSQPMKRGDKSMSTSINRRPVAGPVELTPQGFVGDSATNKKHHGGPDKAVCCYPHEHYPLWRERLNDLLEIPAFGENLTTEGLLESDVCLGDVFRIGSAMVQISQPRQPCGTLAMRNNSSELPKWINEKAFTGFYLRVLEPGEVSVGDAIELLRRPNRGVTIESLLRAMLDKEAPPQRLRKLIQSPELSQAWRETFQKRVAERLAVQPDDPPE